MASTITLQDVVSWAMTFTKMVPIIGVGGFGEEPALSICNTVIAEMLQSPYNWKWNSSPFTTFTTDTAANTQDYLQPLTDCAWIEGCTRIDTLSTQQPQPTVEMNVVRSLQPSSDVGTPEKISFQYETDAGVTFRLWPIPNLARPWTIAPVYQRKAITKPTLEETWGPIPDELAYVYRQGFLAMAYKHADDPRADKEYEKFQQLIRKAMGFGDMEADAEGFVPDWGLFLG